MSLKIGFEHNARSQEQANFTQKSLSVNGIESQLIGGIERLDAALLGGDIDVAVRILKNLPTVQPEGLVITALSERHDPSEIIIMPATTLEAGQIFKIKKGGITGVSTSLQQAQMRDFRPDLTLKMLEGDLTSHFEAMRRGELDALVVAASDMEHAALNLEGFEILKINPREFIPAPAQGVMAWQTNRNDITTRKILQQLHQPEVSAATNVERRILQLLNDAPDTPVGIFCERDKLGNYHVFAVREFNGSLHRARQSSSTNIGLAEKIANQLLM